MSRSHKARSSTRSKMWKDTMGQGRSQARARAGWKRLTSRSARRKDAQQEGRERRGAGQYRVPKDRQRGGRTE